MLRKNRKVSKSAPTDENISMKLQLHWLLSNLFAPSAATFQTLTAELQNWYLHTTNLGCSKSTLNSIWFSSFHHLSLWFWLSVDRTLRRQFCHGKLTEKRRAAVEKSLSSNFSPLPLSPTSPIKELCLPTKIKFILTKPRLSICGIKTYNRYKS